MTMKYLLLTYLNENEWHALSPEAQKAEMEACEPHVKRLMSSGKMLDGAPLEPTSTAATVQYRGGKRLVTDGPFAELREQIGGYTLLEADSRQEAIDIAGGFFTGTPMDGRVTIEVRPVVDYKLPGK
jgi:hypothetical protein